MKKNLLIVFFILVSAVLAAQAVWTGNAGVSLDHEFDDFNHLNDAYLGASNSFPPDTIVSVTNTGNGKTVFVTIVERLNNPGFLILLTETAAKEIDVKNDDILPVQILVVSGSDTQTILEGVSEVPYSEDPDVKPAVPVISTTESVTESESDAIEGEESDREITDIESVTVTVDPDPIPVSDSEPPTSESSVSADETITDEEQKLIDDWLAESIAVAESVEADGTVKDESGVTAPPVADDQVIYFLEESDLRPPVSTSEDETTESPGEHSVEPDEKERYTALLSPDNSKMVDSTIVSSLESGGTYLQIGAYSSKAVLLDQYLHFYRQFPLTVLSTRISGEHVYRLLIGPLKPDESGIVLYRLREEFGRESFPYSTTGE